MVLILFI